MDLLQLQYFQRVAHTRSLTQAAKDLYVSQSTVSQSLKRLETDVGVPLFIHAPGKTLELNESGIVFLKQIESALNLIDNAVIQARQRAENRITLASSIADLCGLFASAFCNERSDVKLSIRLMRIDDIPGLLLTNEVDFAITPCPLHSVSIDCRELYTEESFAIVGSSHPLYGKKCISRERLMRERFICNYSEADRYYLDRIFQEDNVPVDVILETNEPDLIKQTISRGNCTALVPARIVMRRVASGILDIDSVLRIDGCNFDVPTCISRRRDRKLSAEADTFYEFVVHYCRQESEEVRQFIDSL